MLINVQRNLCIFICILGLKGTEKKESLDNTDVEIQCVVGYAFINSVLQHDNEQNERFYKYNPSALSKVKESFRSNS